MLNSNLTITVTNKTDATEALINKTRNILTNILRVHGFGGIWRANMIVRQPLNTNEFCAKSIFEVAGSPRGIKIWTMVGDRDGSFESILFPPPNYSVDSVLAALQNRPTPTKTAKPSKPQPSKPPQPEVVLKQSLPNFQIGMVFAGTVVDIFDHGCLVQLMPGIVGLCHASQWDHKPTLNMHRVCKIGDEVKVMVTKIDKADNKIGLSRKDAMEIDPIDFSEVIGTFTGAVETDGRLLLTNYSSDDDRLLFLLESIAECYPQTFDKPYYCRYIPTKMIWAAWELALIKKYKAKYVSSVYPLIRPLIKKEWISPVETDGVRIGYYITQKGWHEIGGPEIVEIDPNLIDSILTGKPMLVKPTLVEEIPIEKSAPEKSQQVESGSLIQYATKQKRLIELNKQLKDYLPLLEERNQLITWLDQHIELKEQLDQLRSML